MTGRDDAALAEAALWATAAISAVRFGLEIPGFEAAHPALAAQAAAVIAAAALEELGRAGGRPEAVLRRAYTAAALESPAA